MSERTCWDLKARDVVPDLEVRGAPKDVGAALLYAMLMCDGAEKAVSSLPPATLDAACTDALTKYQAQSDKAGFVFTAKDYLCPKLNDPMFLN